MTQDEFMAADPADTDDPEPYSDGRLIKWLQIVPGMMLFAAAAAIVWWQNSRVTVLYDLSGVLEPATRIAQGELPYRDFPFPYAPLTFLTQAWLIKFTGAVYWHHILYACVICGLCTVLAWRIMTYVMLGAVPRPRLTAFLLAIPAAVLGVYCVFPHPFYDPDAAFYVLLSIWLLLCAERRNYPSIPTVIVGLLFVVPLFVKQNIGLAFLCGIGLWLAVNIILARRQKVTVKPWILLLLGIVLGLSAAAVIIHFTFGLENYRYWTWTFATSRRAPSPHDMIAIYADKMLLIWVPFILLGIMLYARNVTSSFASYAASILAIAAPFAWPAAYICLVSDPSERTERLLTLWPLVFIVLGVLFYIFVRRHKGVVSGLPLILVATTHGVFLSQQLWGSTYGIWPILMILIALMLTQIYRPNNGRSRTAFTVGVVLISVFITVAGGSYIYSNERLDYVIFEEGEMEHSKLPQLYGLSMRGDYLPDFDQLIDYTETNIPPDDGILNLPGEDLFFYTTGRKPPFPVLLFDVTNNPYNVDEIRDRILASNIEWMIVKNDLEIEADDMIDNRTKIADAVMPAFRHIDSLDNYEIYKRRHADDPPDDDDDNSPDDSGSDDDGGDGQ